MTSEMMKAGAVGGTDLRNSVLANTSEDIPLEALRVQYLSEIFDLPAPTAVAIAELAFGEGAR